MSDMYDWERYWIPHDVSLPEDAFLHDPQGFLGDKRIVHFDQINDVQCLILVGNPGIGKSETIRHIVETQTSRDQICVLADFRDFESFTELKSNIISDQNYTQWINGQGDLNLFIDSLDEGRLVIKKIVPHILRFIKELPIDRLFFRITCRTAELPVGFYDDLKAIWPDSADRSETQIYHLAQLREADVQIAAQAKRLDPGEFISEVESVGVQSFAAYPITLAMLLNIYDKENKLPDSREEIYAKGIRILAQENSKSRINEHLVGDFEVTRRVVAAQQIAALTQFSNRPRIYMGNEYLLDNAVLSVQDCYLPEDSQMENPETLIRETLQSGLFAGQRENYVIWAHLSYGEYLAADYVTELQMPMRQIQDLFINSSDPEHRIVPKLHETVAWLAQLRPDVFEWILVLEPSILIHSDTIRLTLDQKKNVIEYFINLYATQDIIGERIGATAFQRLNHVQLGEQLRPYLTDKSLALPARDLVMDFVHYCDVNTIDDTLVELALDVDERQDIRVSALYALLHPKRKSDYLDALRSLVFQSSDYRANDQIVALAIDVLWPSHLSADELFSHIQLLPIYDYIDTPYDRVMRSELVDHLTQAELLIALDWVAQQTVEDHNASLGGTEFVNAIMCRAWESVDNGAILISFAKAVWARLTYYSSIFYDADRFWNRDQAPPEYAVELSTDSTKRRQLLQTMLAVLTPESLRNEKILLNLLPWLSSRQLVFVLVDDVRWLIQQMHDPDQEVYHWAYGYLIKRLCDPSDRELVDHIYEECQSQRNPILQEQFRSVFDPISLDSKEAEAGREHLAIQREREEKIQRREARKSPIEDNIREWLDACEEDSAVWWQLSRRLQADGYGRIARLHWDLWEGNAWKRLAVDAKLVDEIINAALRYIVEQNPYIGDIPSSTPTMNRYPAIEGYRALILLGYFRQLHRLSPDDWRRWADLVVLNTYTKEEDLKEIDNLLLRTVSEYAGDQILNTVSKMLESDEQSYQIEAVLKRVLPVSSATVSQLLIHSLQQWTPQNDKFEVVLRLLLQETGLVAQETQLIATSHLEHNSLCELTFHPYTRIAITLIYNAQNGDWWPAVWRLISTNTSFARIVYDAISNRHYSHYLHYLNETHLYDLYLLAVKLYPFSEDIEFHGGTVPPQYAEQQWRDSILPIIAERGTVESVTILNQLYDEMPDIPNIKRLVERARERFRVESWRAPKPADILKLKQDMIRRYIASADELLDLIIVELQEIEKELQGNSTLKRSLWDRQKSVGNGQSWSPVEEEAFSDAICKWLRERLKPVIVNREVEVRLHPDKVRGERTDIQVEAITTGEDTLMVIVEVKCCWYRQLYERIQTQLVNQYLAKNDRCSHGLYLVGYFASDKWREQPNSNICKNRQKDELTANLKEKVEQLTAPKSITVKTFVLDASL